MHNLFLTWLDDWFSKLQIFSFEDLKIDPEKTALISVDMIKGFCSVGPLASKDVASIIPAIVEMFKFCKAKGVEKYVLLQDAHSNNSIEFGAYPPHCLKGTQEAETVDELKRMPFSKEFVVIEKNSLSPAYVTYFDKYLSKNKQIDTFIVVGNCTDLCIYSMAMHLRLSANQTNTLRRIIIPENCVASYDLSVETAQKISGIPHDAALMHKIFLYQMKLNGVEVIRKLV